MNHPRKSFVSRLTVSFLGVSLTAILIVGFISYERARSALESTVYDRLASTLEMREEALNQWVDEKLDHLTLIKTMPDVRKSAEALLCECDPESYTRAYNTLFGAFQIMFVNMADFAEVSLLSGRGGRIIVSSNLEYEGDYRVSDTYFIEGIKKPFIQEIYLSPVTFRPTITVASPISDETGTNVGVLAGHLDMGRLDKIIQERSGLGSTGESYLVDSANAFITGKTFGRADYPRGAHSWAISRALNGESGTGLYRNYAGIPVVGAFKWIGARKLAIMAEIQQWEAFAPARNLAVQIVAAGSLISLFLAVVVNVVVRRIASPILAVREAAEKISSGDRGIRAPVLREDEIGDLAKSFNAMVDDIQENENRLRTVFKMSPGVLVISRMHDNIIADVNEAFTTVTGYSREEVIGQSVLELGLWEDSGEREQFIGKVMKEGTASNFEFLFRVKSGQIKTGFLSAAMVQLKGTPHILFGALDITNLREADRAIKESEARFRTIFMTSPDSVSLSSLEDGKIVDVNEGFLRLTGYSREEALSMNIIDLWLDKEERSRVMEELVSRGEIHNVEGQFRIKNGQVRTGLISASIMEFEGNKHVLGVHKDITEQKRTERALRESEEKYRLLADNVSDVIWVWAGCHPTTSRTSEG